MQNDLICIRMQPGPQCLSSHSIPSLSCGVFCGPGYIFHTCWVTAGLPQQNTCSYVSDVNLRTCWCCYFCHVPPSTLGHDSHFTLLKSHKKCCYVASIHIFLVPACSAICFSSFLVQYVVSENGNGAFGVFKSKMHCWIHPGLSTRQWTAAPGAHNRRRSTNKLQFQLKRQVAITGSLSLNLAVLSWWGSLSPKGVGLFLEIGVRCSQRFFSASFGSGFPS